MKIDYMRVRELRPYPNNARTHSKKQVRQIANSIAKFGFCNPVLIDDDKQISVALTASVPGGEIAARRGGPGKTVAHHDLRLVGEGLEKRDLFVVERSDLHSPD
jgi:hypothetical protein